METAPRRKAVAPAKQSPDADVPETKKEPAAKKVTVIVPKTYTLVLDNHDPVVYKVGTQEMPVAHLEHWWSKANGVKAYQPD